MKRKFKVGMFALLSCVVMNSQIFCVEYLPNERPDIKKDNISMLDESYSKDDVEKVLDIYKDSERIDQEKLDRYDIDRNGYIDPIDASLILDYLNNR